MDDDLTKALQSAKEGKFEEWLHDFLSYNPKDEGLLDGLKKQKRYWLQPIEMELAMLKRTCGPEKEMKYFEAEDVWNKTIGTMKLDLDKGWKPAPLIIEFKDGKFNVADGNHRMGALINSGYKKYWIAIWANNEQDYAQVKNMLAMDERNLTV